MKTWLDSSEIPTKLLINTFIALRNNFVRVLNEAATNTRHPCSHTATTFSPTVHTFPIQWNIRIIIVLNRQNNVLWLIQSLFFLHLIKCIFINKDKVRELAYKPISIKSRQLINKYRNFQLHTIPYQPMLRFVMLSNPNIK